MRCVLAVFALLLLGCGAEPERRGELRVQDVPLPDLSGLDDSVRTQIEDARRRVEELGPGAPRRADVVRGRAQGEFGMTLHACRLHDAAVVAYTNAALLMPRAPRWPYLRGHVLMVRGELDEAVAALRRAVSLLHEDEDASAQRVAALCVLGGAQLELSRPAAADETFAAALRVDTDCAAAVLGRARALRELGETAEALRILRAAAESGDVGRGGCQLLGLLLRESGEPEAADEWLRRGATIERLDSALPDPFLAEMRQHRRYWHESFLRGHEALERGDPVAAERALREALRRGSDKPATYAALAAALVAQGRLDEARTTLRASERAVVPAIVALNLGLLAVHDHDDAEAARRFADAAADARLRLRASFHLAGAHLRRGRFAEAAKLYEAVVSADPLQSRARQGFVRSLAAADRVREALVAARAWMASAPDDADARRDAARVAALVGETEEALVIAAQSAPGAAEIADLETLAFVHAAAGDCARAERLQRRVVLARSESDPAERLTASEDRLAAYRERRGPVTAWESWELADASRRWRFVRDADR